MADETKSKLELLTNLLRVTLWPVIVVVIIIVFWKPIKGLIGNSDTITIGSLTIKVKNEIPKPSPSVKEVLTKLTSKDVSELLYLGNDTSEYNGYDAGALEDAPIDKMVNLKLLKGVEPFKGDTTKNYYKVTRLGADTYTFYIELISVIGKQIDKSEKNE
jgi:hypothetical protein